MLSSNPGSPQALLNLNTFDHVVALLTLPSITNGTLIVGFIIGLIPHGGDYINNLNLFVGKSTNQWMCQFLLLLML